MARKKSTPLTQEDLLNLSPERLDRYLSNRTPAELEALVSGDNPLLRDSARNEIGLRAIGARNGTTAAVSAALSRRTLDELRTLVKNPAVTTWVDLVRGEIGSRIIGAANWNTWNIERALRRRTLQELVSISKSPELTASQQWIVQEEFQRRGVDGSGANVWEE
jgi:hypothetical protein